MAYITLNILVVTGFISLSLYPMIASSVKKAIGARALLKLHYALLLILFIILLLYPLFPVKKSFEPRVKIWSAQSMSNYTHNYSPHKNEGYLEFPDIKRGSSFNTNNAKFIVVCLIISILLTGVLKISYDLYKLFIIKKGSYLIKKYKSVSIYANDNIKIPFSYWLPGMANIIIPTDLLAKSKDLRITLLHELQHHRNGDTKWLFFVLFIKSICILNPFIYLWCRLISELQEFACDEALVDKKKINPQDYASCLFEAARSSSKRRYVSVCATGLTLRIQRKLIKRRIEKIVERVPIQLKWQTNLVVVIVIMGLMTTISCALKGSVQDRRITLEQAAAMAEKAGQDTAFPIVINKSVLHELNNYLGTSEGRDFIEASLKRMKNYRNGIEKKIKVYDVPTEFLAIPLIESGYRNLDASKNKYRCAGIWQFLPSTARAFGLRVDNEVDERLNVDILSDAAMKYLLSNSNRFDDWQLSVLAYNIGERNVQKIIEKAGSTDVWDVSGAFFKNGNNYYAKFMAAVIIMRNPDIITDTRKY